MNSKLCYAVCTKTDQTLASMGTWWKSVTKCGWYLPCILLCLAWAIWLGFKIGGWKGALIVLGFLFVSTLCGAFLEWCTKHVIAYCLLEHAPKPLDKV